MISSDMRNNVKVDSRPVLKELLDIEQSILDLRGDVIEQKMNESSKTPHIRIEFDDINKVPRVYVDGVDVADLDNNHKGLQELDLHWETNTEFETPKSYSIEVLDAENHTSRRFGQSNKC